MTHLCQNIKDDKTKTKTKEIKIKPFISDLAKEKSKKEFHYISIDFFLVFSSFNRDIIIQIRGKKSQSIQTQQDFITFCFESVV